MADLGNGWKMNRRNMLALLGSAAASPAIAKAPTRSERPIQRPGASNEPEVARDIVAELVETSGLRGKTSAVVMNVETGEIVDVYKPVRAHPPASTLKALTALYAHETLGAGHRFVTELRYRGMLKDGVLEGDLILHGGCDPTLDSDDLLDLAAQMKEAGLRELRGRFVVDARALPQAVEIDTDQPDHVSYNPAVSALNLNFNRVFLEWERGKQGYVLTMDARALKVRPAVSTAQISVVERNGPVFTYQRGNKHDIWTVSKGALGQEGGRWLPVRHPDIYAGDVFQSLARSHGIVLPYPVADDGTGFDGVIARKESAPLHEISRGMMKYSTNLTAEVLGMSGSATRGAAGGLPGSGSSMAKWLDETYGAAKSRFVDHSGLGDRSRMTAVDMARALASPASAAVLQPLMNNIPIATREGDKQPDPNFAVLAKTGTLNFVSGLAGYIIRKTGPNLAFAIFSSDLDRKSALSEQQRERPRGGRAWSGQARRLQREILRHWARVDVS